MKPILRLAAFLCLLAFQCYSYAGNYSCTAIGDAGCSEHIRDIVTDKFTSKYPSAKYTIVVIYEFTPYSGGGGSGFAIAGLSKIPADGDANKTIIPVRRFTSTMGIPLSDFVNSYDRTKNVIYLIRKSVEDMMEACERIPSCDLLK